MYFKPPKHIPPESDLEKVECELRSLGIIGEIRSL